MTPSAITVENISKAYRIGHREEPADTMMAAGISLLKSPWKNFQDLRQLNTHQDQNGQDTLWAIKDISFDVHVGEAIGIIGKNGAGKSTLLKVLSRITEPTSGRAVIRGRISSLLEVGTGFHPELTGRENIYMNGTILGMRKSEIDRKFDEIVDFSGIERFLDTPSKRYSSGMQVRLAFAVAAHLEPEILIIDEVLAVGDADFQQKCMSKMRDVASGGRTVLLVSHNMDAVSKLCDRCVYIKHGRTHMTGSTASVLREYMAPSDIDAVTYPAENEREGQGSFRITSVSINDIHGNSRNAVLDSGKPITVNIQAEQRTDTHEATAAIVSIIDGNGKCIFICDARLHNKQFQSNEPSFTTVFEIKGPWLKPGKYTVQALLVARGLVDRIEVAALLEVKPTLPYKFSAPPWVLSHGEVFADFECNIEPHQ